MIPRHEQRRCFYELRVENYVNRPKLVFVHENSWSLCDMQRNSFLGLQCSIQSYYAVLMRPNCEGYSVSRLDGDRSQPVSCVVLGMVSVIFVLDEWMGFLENCVDKCCSCYRVSCEPLLLKRQHLFGHEYRICAYRYFWPLTNKLRSRQRNN